LASKTADKLVPMSWQPITLAPATEAEVHAQSGSTVSVRVPISPTPDGDWVAIFNSGPPAGVTHSPAIGYPSASEQWVHFQCSAEKVAQMYEQARGWVDGTNAAYQRDVIPARQRYEQETAEEQRKRDEAEAEAKRQLGQDPNS
jgi:hypothetical protein